MHAQHCMYMLCSHTHDVLCYTSCVLCLCAPVCYVCTLCMLRTCVAVHATWLLSGTCTT
jgi:hypothetical protein